MFQVLLREGLVAILVDKVTSFVKENGRVHSKISAHLEESKRSASYGDDVDLASDNDKQQLPALRCVDHDNVVF
jgi:hypothetical protein